MADTLSSLRAILLADSAVTALVGTNIAAPRFRGTPPLPSLTLATIRPQGASAEGMGSSYGRGNNIEIHGIEVTAYAETGLEAFAVTETARTALMGSEATRTAIHATLRAYDILDITERQTSTTGVLEFQPDFGTPSETILLTVISLRLSDASLFAKADERKIVLAESRSLDTTVSLTALGGDLSFTVASISGWAEGSLVFCSESDDTDNDYLGPVTDITGNVVTTTFGLKNPKQANWKVWTPTNSWRSLLDTIPSTEYNEGMERFQTLDGTTRNTSIQDPAWLITIDYAKQYDYAYATLRAFLTDTAGRGATDFTMAWYDFSTGIRRVDTVRLISPTPAFAMDIISLTQAQFQVQVITEDAYAG